MTRLIIGLIGDTGSGKGAARRYLERHHGFLLHRFTDTPRRMLRVIGLQDSDFEGDARYRTMDEFGGATPNHLLSSLSHAWGRRMVHTDIWGSAWAKEAKVRGGDLVADDIRYFNEAATLRGVGGVMVRIEGPKLEGVPDRHGQRETREMAVDATVVNSGDLLELHASLDALVANLRGHSSDRRATA